LFPHDQDARRLSRQCVLLGELLARDPDYKPLRLSRHMHAHCHHKAVMGTDADTGLLKAMGLELECPETGCCGLAGSFGYEREHYEVSMRIGERVLLPAVRRASHETLIIADGFSCRSQIKHSTPRCALHLAEVLQMALRESAADVPSAYPERAFAQPAAKMTAARATAGVLIGATALMLY
jgi:Fe-S oxidoreductase